MLTLANSHFLPFQIDSRVKAKDPTLASVIPAYHHPFNSLSLPFAFPDPSEGWAEPLPRATRRKKETGLSGCDCPKGVGLILPIGSDQKKWNRPVLNTSRTQLPLQIVHNQRSQARWQITGNKSGLGGILYLKDLCSVPLKGCSERLFEGPSTLGW